MLLCNLWSECNCKMFHYCVFRTNVERSTPVATVRFVESFESVSFQLRLVSRATR